MDYQSYQAGKQPKPDQANHFVFDNTESSTLFEGISSSSSHIPQLQTTTTDNQESPPSPLVTTLTFLASISGFMFGYDTGYISSALVVIGDDLGQMLTYKDKELITSATSLGALVASVGAGILADLFGRKSMIMSSNVLFIIGASLQCIAHEVHTMVYGRFVMGLGVGFGSLIAPLYISELAPTRYRGRLVVTNVLLITTGQLVAYSIGAMIDNVHNGWRILIGLSLLPSTLQMVMFLFMPDTPRYLIMKNRLDEAVGVLQRIYKDQDKSTIESQVQDLYRVNSEIDGSNLFTKTWRAIKEIHTLPSNLRALVLGCGLQGIQQFTGWNALMYFCATIFQMVGFDNSSAVSIFIAMTNFIFTAVAFFVIDRVGRRRVLLFGLPVMMFSLILCSIAFHKLGIEFHSDELVVHDTTKSHWSIVIVVGMILYASGYAVGIGNVPWQQSELFPQNVRGIGASYATATNWAGSLTISLTFLTMLQKFSPAGTFFIFTIVTLISIVFVYFCYPELSGLDLEEAQSILTGGFNVQMSLQLSMARRDGISDDLLSNITGQTDLTNAFDDPKLTQQS